jgi:hypothetical protein
MKKISKYFFTHNGIAQSFAVNKWNEGKQNGLTDSGHHYPG